MVLGDGLLRFGVELPLDAVFRQSFGKAASASYGIPGNFGTRNTMRSADLPFARDEFGR